MKLISTTVSGEFVRLRYATDPEPAKAHEWLDFRVRLTAMKNTSGGPDQPIEDRELQHLAELHRGALLQAREIIDSEIQRLRELADRIS
jgi:hypothetical protein